MKNYKLIWCCFVLVLVCTSSGKRITEKEPMPTEKIFPQFPGGKQAYEKFMSRKIHYPITALKKDLEGSIRGYCIVNRDGTIKTISTESIIGNELDAEVMKALRTLPKFTPASPNAPNHTLFIMPIIFKIPREGKTRNVQIEIADRIRPQFEGGQQEFYKYIGSKLAYSFTDSIRNKEGEVIAHFVMSGKGKLKQTKIVKSFSPEYDNSVLRMLQEMPLWEEAEGRFANYDYLFQLTMSYDVEQTEIMCDLDYIVPPISADKLPEGFFDDYFENRDKVEYMSPLTIIGYKK